MFFSLMSSMGNLVLLLCPARSIEGIKTVEMFLNLHPIAIAKVCSKVRYDHSVPPPLPPLSAGDEVEPPNKFTKKGGLTEPQV